ncbi:expressed unknown protein [Seminavis robusta]|uniref:Uncharacterized protein n=1 Tax=Seminavis robusta TaxID=568900 RepID=A0A9N8HQV6_9STRA|nr:expressed unknown protein [Seminavis robusta]|eukprot:Sro1020_g232110.1 n/a (278) ;mRNA; r:15156-15989
MGMDMNNMDMDSTTDYMPPTWSLITGREATIFGHVVPGLVYAIGALTVALVSYHRANNLPPGKSFMEAHVPEKDKRFLFLFGFWIAAALLPILIWQTTLGLLQKGYFDTSVDNMVIILSFFHVGVLAMLESKGRLPPDSWRRGIALAFFLQTIIMVPHSMMLAHVVQRRFHGILAFSGFGCALMMSHSVYDPTSGMAFIASLALIVLHGAWWITIGFYSCCFDMPLHHITTKFALEILGIAMASAWAVSTLDIPKKENVQGGGSEELSLWRRLQQDN